nr:uncharacterized protein LOC108124712 [Drosophila bipectinata]
MPRRRRPRCKLNQSMVVRKKNPETDPPNEEPPCEEPQNEEPQSEEPLSEEPVSEEPPEVESTSSADPPSGDDTDYRLFPEIYNRQPWLPTFADIFGQPSYRAGFELEETPSTSANSHENEMGIQSSPDGRFTNIPSTMLGDRFGMTGLLAAMRATQTDPSSTQLVFGEDLTTFGLDLAARGDIYVHFNGPFTHSPPERSSMDCALEMGMRAMRDAMVMYPTMAPVWDPFQPETGHLGLVGGGGKDGSKESVPETGPPAEVPTPEPVVAAPVRERGRERHRNFQRERKREPARDRPR